MLDGNAKGPISGTCRMHGVALVVFCAVWSLPATAGQPGATAPASAGSAARLRVAVFYSPTCAGCREFEAALANSQRRWGDRVGFERRHLVRKEAFAELLVYQEHYRVKEDDIPQAFLGRQVICGLETIIRRLDGAIERELGNSSVTFDPSEPTRQVLAAGQAVPPNVLERFRGFTVGAVVAAGLLDGVNPCAFTTIIFLLSVLAYRRKSRRELALVGIGFASAIFATYLLLGFGMLEAVKVFSVSHGISRALAYGVAALALGLAAWSLLDAVRYARSRDVRQVTLGLPKAVKERVRQVIRVGLSTRSLVIGSVTVGFVVALLESLCTGQIYLPTIMLVARAPGLRADAVGYLVLYNVMFTVPLIVILVIAFLGVRSERLGEFLVRHLVAFKLALAGLFAGLGVLVLATV